jgi:predicted PhzF superfamily epimerase YddE/YHI9
MNPGTLYRRAAFTDNPKGGNPAGVWVCETLPSVDVMQRIAAEVGYSETAFVAPTGGQTRTIRYYSPEMEVPSRAYAGVWHLVLAINDPHRPAKLNYDFERLKALMLREGLTTRQFAWRDSTHAFQYGEQGSTKNPATHKFLAAPTVPPTQGI